jgi:DNA repair ATPase RecN
LEYQTKTVQEILNQMSSSLEQDAVEYTRQAQRVAEWDGVLRDSHASLEDLTEQVGKLLFQQQEVDRTLNGVDAYQQELSTTLDGLEVNTYI